MKSPVFYTPARGNSRRNKFTRLGELVERVGLAGRFDPGDLIAVKVHWGEPGNADFLSPVFTRQLVGVLTGAGTRPFVTDSNTLYRGGRHRAPENLEAAAANGFTQQTLGCPVIVADGLRGFDYREVPVAGRHVQSARVASAIAEADGLVVVSHVKGHMVFGFGGALKNLGMGCSAAAAKQFLHADVRPRVKSEDCVGCGHCAAHCAFDAIGLVPGSRGKGRVARVDPDRCAGCGECLVVCPEEAIPIDWGDDYDGCQEKSAEYARAAVAGKESRTVYFNFVVSVTPDCDCCSWSDAPLVPDIGYLASHDPVAIDLASVELVNGFTGFPDRYPVPSGDHFREVHGVDWMVSLRHAAALGLGNLEYDLVEV